MNHKFIAAEHVIPPIPTDYTALCSWIAYLQNSECLLRITATAFHMVPRFMSILLLKNDSFSYSIKKLI
jgi:hypothetical protein